MQKFIINQDDTGIRLDRWAKRNLPQIPHSLLQRMLRKGQLRLNTKKAQANQRVAAGDEIIIRAGVFNPRADQRTENQKSNNQHLAKEFRKLIIFENDDYIVINKPPGLASQGGSGIKISVDDMIREISPRYKLVHRLDKDTSGVLAIAKKTTAASRFAEALKGKKMTKIYWALVRGVPPKQKGIIKLSLAKKGTRMEKVEVDEEGKKSITEYTVLENLAGELSWLELSPITGRTHQLRVHCAAIGCPIIGDGKYGGAVSFEKGLSNKLHLHARRLYTKELGIDVTAPLPDHMQDVAPDI